MVNETRNVKLVVSYDGTGFHGFQKQAHGQRTVQMELEKSLKDLLGEDIETSGASRTDAGVHSLGQTVSFFTASSIPPERIAPALLRYLPVDIKAVESCEVDKEFNARFSAKGKIYDYIIDRYSVQLPFMRNAAFHISRKIDIDKMRNACKYLIGEKDFSCFKNAGSSQTSTIRRIDEVKIVENGYFLVITVKGSAFLYRMVRNIAGTLIEVGLGRFPVESMETIIESKDRSCSGPTLPPQGLYLRKVIYE